MISHCVLLNSYSAAASSSAVPSELDPWAAAVPSETDLAVDPSVAADPSEPDLAADPSVVAVPSEPDLVAVPSDAAGPLAADIPFDFGPLAAGPFDPGRLVAVEPLYWVNVFRHLQSP